MNTAAPNPRRPTWVTDPLPRRDRQRTIRFVDLSEISFQGHDVRDVTMVGCDLSGASFTDADLTGLTLTGCFAWNTSPPVSFDVDSPAPRLIHCHLANVTLPASPQPTWPERAAELGQRATMGDNSERYTATLDLGNSAFPPAGALLGYILGDEEWDVRAAALQAIASLRGPGFPDDDKAILLAAFAAAGDENSLVSARAVELIKSTGAPDDLIAQVIGNAHADDVTAVVPALRAVVTLSRDDVLRDTVATYFDGNSLTHLMKSPDPVARAEYLNSLAATDVGSPEIWKAGLRDPERSVRIRSLIGIRMLDEPPPAGLMEVLLKDPDEGVRIEALFTLGHIGDFDRAAVILCLRDPSEEVRRYAALLLKR